MKKVTLLVLVSASLFSGAFSSMASAARSSGVVYCYKNEHGNNPYRIAVSYEYNIVDYSEKMHIGAVYKERWLSGKYVRVGTYKGGNQDISPIGSEMICGRHFSPYVYQ
jgi:hypothetical protein